MNRVCTICLLWLTLLCAACFKKEQPIPAHDAGTLQEVTVSMGAGYKAQVYYSLKDNKEVGRNEKEVWHLGFEAAATDGDHVILNSAMMMFAYNTGKQAFQDVTMADTAGHKSWDNPNGDLEATAIADWGAENNVYLIDCGTDGSGVALGFKKVQFLSVNNAEYQLLLANVDGSGKKTVTITKDTSYNFIFLNLLTGATVTVEPPRDSWDIVFTQYTHIYPDMDDLAYRVTGCLLNRYNTTAVMDSMISVADLDMSAAANYDFSAAINTIGFEWKAYVGDFGSGGYQVQTQNTYLIKDQNGLYYALHFLDFISGEGITKFAYRQL